MLVIYHGETPLVNCGPRSILLHLNTNLLQSFTFCIFLQVTIIFHTIRLILCFQQAGEIDTLTGTLGQSFLVVLCTGDVSSPTGTITLVSFLRENLLLHSSYLPLGVSQRTCDLYVSSSFSGAIAGEKRRSCLTNFNSCQQPLFLAPLSSSCRKGSLTLPTFLLCYCLA